MPNSPEIIGLICHYWPDVGPGPGILCGWFGSILRTRIASRKIAFKGFSKYLTMFAHRFWKKRGGGRRDRRRGGRRDRTEKDQDQEEEIEEEGKKRQKKIKIKKKTKQKKKKKKRKKKY